MFFLMNSSLQPKIEVLMDTDFNIIFDYSVVCVSPHVSFSLTVSVTKDKNLAIIGKSEFVISCESATETIVGLSNLKNAWNKTGQSKQSTESRSVYIADGQIDVKMRSGIIGYSDVIFSIQSVGNETENMTTVKGLNKSNSTANLTIFDPESSYKTLSYKVTIIRKMRPLDKLFRVVVYAVQIIIATGFGAKLDLQVVKENLFRPVAPGIGLASQYLLMPLIAFGASRAVSGEMPTIALGIFLAGCCPGGGASNTYSYLLKGDLSLSITMTALSTIAALAMLPFWLYTLGRTFTSGGEELSIPFEMVAVSLSVLILPLVGGVMLRQKFRKAADLLQKILKPFIVIMALVLIIVGVLANLYIFRLFNPKIILAACLLPYVGFICGGVVATIFRQPWARIKTISIETGMQNTSIAYILLINSFPSPSGDIAAVAPVASAVMTPLPPFIVTICYLTYQSWKKRKTVADDKNRHKVIVSNEVETAIEKEAENEKLLTEMTPIEEKSVIISPEPCITASDKKENVESADSTVVVSDNNEQAPKSENGISNLDKYD